MTPRVSVNYIRGSAMPYEVENIHEDGIGKITEVPTLKKAIAIAKILAKERGCEVWVFDGTIYDKNGRKK